MVWKRMDAYVCVHAFQWTGYNLVQFVGYFAVKKEEERKEKETRIAKKREQG